MTTHQTPLIIGIGGTLRESSRSLHALAFALHIAEEHGANTKLLDVRKYQLPMFDPALDLEDYDSNVQEFVHLAGEAQGMIWSTGAYHGTLAGVTKNAIDFLEFLGDNREPYLHNKAVGLIATAGGDIAGVNSLNAMVHSVHALRGTVVPLQVTIPQASKAITADGEIVVEKWSNRLAQMARMTVQTANKLNVSLISEGK